MSNRKSISSKLRFEVFKRDSFTCQYCGGKAPGVILHADHIKPVSKGGDGDITNLITSCSDCNSGKGARELSDDSVIAKQRAQLDELNERRNQLEMMLEWREGLKGLRDKHIEAIAECFHKATNHVVTVNEHGHRKISAWLDRFTLGELLDATEKSVRQYIRFDEHGCARETAEKAFTYIPRIASVVKNGGMPEHMQRLFYIRAILRNRLSYVSERDVIPLMREAYEAGICLDWLTSYAKVVRNWTNFRSALQDFINEHGGDEDGPN